MARTRTTIRRVDPWSILKFGFVANLVLLGIQLLAGAVIWYVIQRLELIQTVCELAATVGFEECGVDGGALFDTFLVLGLLGVVIQTGILVFLTFLANLIFDLTGGIVLTLEDDRHTSPGPARPAGAGTRSAGTSTGRPPPIGTSAGADGRAGRSTETGSEDTTQMPLGASGGRSSSRGSGSSSSPSSGDDEKLFGSS